MRLRDPRSSYRTSTNARDLDSITGQASSRPRILFTSMHEHRMLRSLACLSLCMRFTRQVRITRSRDRGLEARFFRSTIRRTVNAMGIIELKELDLIK